MKQSIFQAAYDEDRGIHSVDSGAKKHIFHVKYTCRGEVFCHLTDFPTLSGAIALVNEFKAKGFSAWTEQVR